MMSLDSLSLTWAIIVAALLLVSVAGWAVVILKVLGTSRKSPPPAVIGFVSAPTFDAAGGAATARRESSARAPNMSVGVFRRNQLVGTTAMRPGAGGRSVGFGEGPVWRSAGSSWTTDAPDAELARLPRDVFRPLLLAALALLLPLAAHAARALPDEDVHGDSAARVYHPEALAWVADEPPGSPGVPTHLRVEGEVRAAPRQERDGDVHIILCHNGRCVVAECIPGLPISVIETIKGRPTSKALVASSACAELRAGLRIAVWGISRYDGAPGHEEQSEAGSGRRGHWEIHPVEGIEVLPPLPGGRP